MFDRLFGVGKLNHPAFGALVMKLGLESGHFEDPVYDDDTFTIAHSRGVAYLHDAYGQFIVLSRKERLPFLRHWVRNSEPGGAPPETWDEARKLVLPRVRDDAFVTLATLQLQLAGVDKAREIAARPLAPGLHESLVIDLPTQMLSITSVELRTWNVSLDEAAESARDNLRRKIDDTMTAIAPSIWCVAGDEYTASWLVLPDVLQRTCTNPLVVIPNRTMLIIADASVPGIFDALVELLEKVSGGPDTHPITNRIYQLDGKTIRPFSPPASSAKLGAYDRLLVQEDMVRYGSEAKLRNALGGDVFYPKMMSIQVLDGRVLRLTTWTMSIESALPPADVVSFVEVDASSGTALRTWRVPWTTVESSGLVKRTEAALQRWHTVKEPTPAWLDANADDTLERFMAENAKRVENHRG